MPVAGDGVGTRERSRPGSGLKPGEPVTRGMPGPHTAARSGNRRAATASPYPCGSALVPLAATTAATCSPRYLAAATTSPSGGAGCGRRRGIRVAPGREDRPASSRIPATFTCRQPPASRGQLRQPPTPRSGPPAAAADGRGSTSQHDRVHRQPGETVLRARRPPPGQVGRGPGGDQRGDRHGRGLGWQAAPAQPESVRRVNRWMVLEVTHGHSLLRPGARIGVWAATKLATDAGGWRQVNRAGHPMMWPIFWPGDTDFSNPANSRHRPRTSRRQPGTSVSRSPRWWRPAAPC